MVGLNILANTDLDHLEAVVSEQLGNTGSSAVLSPCHSYRYLLTRVWDPKIPPALFIMLNPSTATALVDDPTIRRCIRFAIRERAGGLVVANAFALRATDPGELEGHPDPVGPDNDEVLLTVLLSPARPVIVAWGANKTLRASGRDLEIIRMIHVGGDEPQCLGQTKDGYPRHPLYVPGNKLLEPYPNAHAYADFSSRMVS